VSRLPNATSQDIDIHASTHWFWILIKTRTMLSLSHESYQWSNGSKRKSQPDPFEGMKLEIAVDSMPWMISSMSLVWD
jgi:hypothetical protein